MKKFLSLFLLLAIVFSIVACGKEDESSENLAPTPVIVTSQGAQSTVATVNFINEAQVIVDVTSISGANAIRLLVTTGGQVLYDNIGNVTQAAIDLGQLLGFSVPSFGTVVLNIQIQALTGTSPLTELSAPAVLTIQNGFGNIFGGLSGSSNLANPYLR